MKRRRGGPLRAIRFVLMLLLLLLTVAGGWGYLAGTGYWGQRQAPGEIILEPRNLAAEPEMMRSDKQILFGDLHAHTTFSFDAFNISLPMYGGEGSHPPSDACDFARYCSALDFWSINDHAEGLTPRQWSLTRDAVRQCNAVAGDPQNPDMVTFLGWEWTQIGNIPDQHYGHKNVILKDTAEGKTPVRPISSREQLFPGGADPFGIPMRLLFIAGGMGDQGRQPYHDFARFLEDRAQLETCPSGVPVRSLPTDCQESAPTPTELFGKLDDWGFPYMVIPHGNTWGFYTPPLTSWDKQLAAHTTPDKHEPLIEVFSGHGNTEQYRSWRARGIDENGAEYCAAPTEDFLPECWRAGEIIFERCILAGESSEVCEQRAAATRANFILTKDSGHWTVPGATIEDWLNAGQCTDCYMPAYNYRPASSVQYGLAIRDFSVDGEPKRFRWGMIGSSDVHTARPGTGYKEFQRLNMTDAGLGRLGPPAILKDTEPTAEFASVKEAGGFLSPNFERFASFFGTGGLVAVHSEGRSRDAVWDALQRKEVYATSGDRIMLWFDLQNGAQSAAMGSSIRSRQNPSFEITAVGAFEQKPGCPPDTLRVMPADKLQRLCGGECYHPSDRRKRIDRIEVVRILPQNSPEEDVAGLIQDPWRTLPCPSSSDGCSVQFSDEDYASNARDAVYYVRAIEEASPTINADQLRCELDEQGQCMTVNPCRATLPTDPADDCLASAEERAWSSPIYVDWDSASQAN